MEHSKFKQAYFSQHISKARAGFTQPFLNEQSTLGRAGFTFIELLTAIFIFSIIAVSVYSVFHTGVSSWRSLDSAADIYLETRGALDLMANEIASYVPSKKIPFEGDAQTISFLSKPYRCDLAKVNFYLDSFTNTLMRSQEGLKSVSNGSSQDIVKEEFLPNVETLGFKYLCQGRAADKKDAREWLDHLDPDKYICRAVSVSVKNRNISFTKTVLLYAEGNDE